MGDDKLNLPLKTFNQFTIGANQALFGFQFQQQWARCFFQSRQWNFSDSTHHPVLCLELLLQLQAFECGSYILNQITVYEFRNSVMDSNSH